MTREELKDRVRHDAFTDTVSNVVAYSSVHRQTLIRYGIIAGIALLITCVAIWLSNYRSSIRQAELSSAFNVLDTPIGTPGANGKSFATSDEKTKASQKALNDILAKDAGTREGYIAQYYLGTIKAQNQDSKGAESNLTAVANSRSEVSSLAKIALAQLYISESKRPQAENLLREVVNKPTDLVSKPQAQILLAQVLEGSNPREAQKILNLLRSPGQTPAVTRAIDQVASQATK